jgi:hypothetical protein
MSAQYRVVRGKNDEVIDGADDADVVIMVPAVVAADEGFDATVEFMRGRLKAVGNTGALFEVLRSGEAGRTLSRLASPS